MVTWHKADLENRMYCNIEHGKKIAMPRYYKIKLYNSEEKGYLKGAFEKLRRQLDEKKIRQNKVRTFKQQSEAVKAAFRKMYKSDTKQKV